MKTKPEFYDETELLIKIKQLRKINKALLDAAKETLSYVQYIGWSGHQGVYERLTKAILQAETRP